jgi:hypothetical protein
MEKDQNWLSQTGKNFTDLDFIELGISEDLVKKQGFNRAMLDLVHSQNMAGYISDGMSESEARFKADKQKSKAIKAAKENGLVF